MERFAYESIKKAISSLQTNQFNIFIYIFLSQTLHVMTLKFF